MGKSNRMRPVRRTPPAEPTVMLFIKYHEEDSQGNPVAKVALSAQVAATLKNSEVDFTKVPGAIKHTYKFGKTFQQNEYAAVQRFAKNTLKDILPEGLHSSCRYFRRASVDGVNTWEIEIPATLTETQGETFISGLAGNLNSVVVPAKLTASGSVQPEILKLACNAELNSQVGLDVAVESWKTAKDAWVALAKACDNSDLTPAEGSEQAQAEQMKESSLTVLEAFLRGASIGLDADNSLNTLMDSIGNQTKVDLSMIEDPGVLKIIKQAQAAQVAMTLARKRQIQAGAANKKSSGVIIKPLKAQLKQLNDTEKSLEAQTVSIYSDSLKSGMIQQVQLAEMSDGKVSVELAQDAGRVSEAETAFAQRQRVSSKVITNVREKGLKAVPDSKWAPSALQKKAVDLKNSVWYAMPRAFRAALKPAQLATVLGIKLPWKALSGAVKKTGNAFLYESSLKTARFEAMFDRACDSHNVIAGASEQRSYVLQFANNPERARRAAQDRLKYIADTIKGETPWAMDLLQQDPDIKKQIDPRRYEESLSSLWEQALTKDMEPGKERDKAIAALKQNKLKDAKLKLRKLKVDLGALEEGVYDLFARKIVNRLIEAIENTPGFKEGQLNEGIHAIHKQLTNRSGDAADIINLAKEYAAALDIDSEAGDETTITLRHIYKEQVDRDIGSEIAGKLPYNVFFVPVMQATGLKQGRELSKARSDEKITKELEEDTKFVLAVINDLKADDPLYGVWRASGTPSVKRMFAEYIATELRIDGEPVNKANIGKVQALYKEKATLTDMFKQRSAFIQKQRAASETYKQNTNSLPESTIVLDAKTRAPVVGDEELAAAWLKLKKPEAEASFTATLSQLKTEVSDNTASILAAETTEYKAFEAGLIGVSNEQNKSINEQLDNTQSGNNAEFYQKLQATAPTALFDEIKTTGHYDNIKRVGNKAMRVKSFSDHRAQFELREHKPDYNLLKANPQTVYLWKGRVTGSWHYAKLDKNTRGVTQHSFYNAKGKHSPLIKLLNKAELGPIKEPAATIRLLSKATSQSIEAKDFDFEFCEKEPKDDALNVPGRIYLWREKGTYKFKCHHKDGIIETGNFGNLLKNLTTKRELYKHLNKRYREKNFAPIIDQRITELILKRMNYSLGEDKLTDIEQEAIRDLSSFDQFDFYSLAGMFMGDQTYSHLVEGMPKAHQFIQGLFYFISWMKTGRPYTFEMLKDPMHRAEYLMASPKYVKRIKTLLKDLLQEEPDGEIVLDLAEVSNMQPATQVALAAIAKLDGYTVKGYPAKKQGDPDLIAAADQIVAHVKQELGDTGVAEADRMARLRETRTGKATQKALTADDQPVQVQVQGKKSQREPISVEAKNVTFLSRVERKPEEKTAGSSSGLKIKKNTV